MDYSKLRVIYYNSEEIKIQDMIWGFLELGVNLECSDIIVSHNIIDSNQVERLTAELANYDFAVTQDFSVNVAEACHICNVKYISWIYDSPQVALHTSYARYDENYIFTFDKIQLDILIKSGCKHVFYQPLASNLSYLSTLKHDVGESNKYSADISFVGQLYRKKNLNTLFAKLSDQQKDIFLRICNLYACKWNDQLSIFDNTFDTYVQTLTSEIKQSEFRYYEMDPLYTVKSLFLAPFITHVDRIRILTELGNNFNATLYTTDSDFEYAKTFFKGQVYPKIPREQSYKVFKYSKLNLNTTLRTIESGIPLRVFDIIGVGGAVITNWQPEIDELFIRDKEIIVYQSLEELIDKTRFYLSHEKSLEKIAINGKNRAINEHNVTNAVRNIINKSI